MSTGYRIRGALVAIAVALAVANALAFGYTHTGRLLALWMQLAVSAAAIGYGLLVARQVAGAARWWRLLAVGAIASLCVGELSWWYSPGQIPAWGVAAYFGFLLLGLAAILVIANGSGGVMREWITSDTSTITTTVLDGLVAGVSFAILVLAGELGTPSRVPLPRSGSPGIETAYALGELAVVVIAAVIGMVYASDRPCRTNYLLLGSGLVLIGAADRVVAYFDSVDPSRGAISAGIGMMLGPLLVAYAMRDAADPAPTAQLRPMDWAQLTLPYSGFLGATVLLAFHLLTGNQLTALEIVAAVAMVVLVTVRQVVATGAQRVLTRRLEEAQRTLAHQVLHDALTGLPNRLYFAQRLDEAMRDRRFVLIFVDLDDFKDVNDRFGHAAGDDLLCAVGERLARWVGEGDMLARIGGDEFAILIGGEAESPDVVAERLRVALREPFPVHGSSVRVRASMGLVRPGVDGAPQTSDDLLRQADISMYAGKRLGKDTAIVYQPSAGVHADFPTALRRAGGGVPAGFSLAYQPIVALPGRAGVAVEVLARWIAPNGIHIPPQTFVSGAEAAGMGAVLDATVLDIACREVQAAGLDADIHVNIGAARLGNADFERRLRETLDRHGVAPHRLVVEVTETVPIVDLPDAAAQINRLRTAGVRVALDDFGAGYNSLTYLHTLPVHIVKLDRSLAVVADRQRDQALYGSVVGLCADLGIEVIAEGIESVEQLDIVAAAGCRLAQGRLFGWPAPIADVAALWNAPSAESRGDSAAMSSNGD